MADPPYGLDFLFNNIVDVHFGGVWIVVTIDGSSPAALGGSIDFPGFAGGTPGVAIGNPAFSPYPHIVTAADIKASLKTGAGLALTGFGVNQITAPPHTPLANQLSFSDENNDIFGYSRATHVFILAPTSTLFQVRVDFTATPAPPAGTAVACWPLSSGTVKAGLSPPLPLPAFYPSPLQASKTNIIGSSGSVSFQVDPAAMTVTRL